MRYNNKYIIIFLLSLLCGLMMSCSKETPGTIDDMLFLRHKGADMPIIVKGQESSNDIILIVHGGPGGNAFVYSFDFKNSFEKEYIVAYWDQRASGSSQGNPDESTFTYEQFAQDIYVTAKLLKDKYSNRNIILLGHSFGVEILLQCMVNPEYSKVIKGYVIVNGTHSGYSYYYWQRQWVIDECEFERFFSSIHNEAYTYAIDNPVTKENWHHYDGYKLYEYMVELGGYNNYSQDSTEPIGMFDIINSPYSSWSEFVNTYFGAGGPMFDNFSYFDLTNELNKVTTPGLIIFGEKDGNVPVEIGYELDSLLVNSPHSFEIFNYSGHSPMIDEPKKFYYTVRSFIEGI